MPDLNPLQSEPIGQRFDAFLKGFQNLSASYTMAGVLMHYVSDLLIQLSLIHQTVKLLESQITGRDYSGSDIKAIAEKLNTRLSDFYQGIASFQLSRHMQHSQQLANNAATLTQASKVLDQKITKLNDTNRVLKIFAADTAKQQISKLNDVDEHDSKKDQGVGNDKGDYKSTKRR